MKAMILKCCCCGDDLYEADEKFCAEFGGKLRTVCKECGTGIYNGLRILSDLNVNGECKPDNQTR